MTRKFQQNEQGIYIGLFNAGAATETGTDAIQFVVRKVTIASATAKYINIEDAATGEDIAKVLPQVVCETPADTERQAFRFGVFGDMPMKAAMEMAQDLGRHWQALTIDNMVIQIDSMRRQAEAQKYPNFREQREKAIAEKQDQLEFFGLREVEAIAFKQPDKIKRKVIP